MNPEVLKHLQVETPSIAESVTVDASRQSLGTMEGHSPVVPFSEIIKVHTGSHHKGIVEGYLQVDEYPTAWVAQKLDTCRTACILNLSIWIKERNYI